MEKNSSLVSDSEATVFVDTSLGTHMAVTACHDETVSALKRKIEYEHQLCFTSIGKIIVEGLKVKRKGFFYHLSNSMFVKNAFCGVNKNWFLSADASVVPRKRLSNFDDSIPLLLEGSERGKEKATIADQNGSVDYARETPKGLEIGVKHSDNDHCTTSFHETINRPEPEIQDDLSLCSEGYRIPTTQECKEASSRKESDVHCNVSLEKPLPAERKKQCKTKHRNKETVENDASVHGFGKEQSQPDIIPPENSLGNQSRDISCDMTIGEKNTTEEPCKSSASTMDNRSDSGIHRTNDTYKETEVPGENIESGKNTSMEDASQSQPAAKKKRKIESISGREDSLKENNALIYDSKFNNETSKPEIASEFSLGDKQKNENATLDGLTAESSDLLTNSSSRRKKKIKKSSSSLDQVVAAGINDKYSGGDDVASINEQGLQGVGLPKLCGISLKQNHCALVQELRENYVPSSLHVTNTTEAGNMESNTNTAKEILDGHPHIVVKIPREGGTDLAERVGEERKSSQRKDSKSVMSGKDKGPSQDNRDGNDTNVIVTSELLDANGTVTHNNTSKKKKKIRKTKDSIGETQIKSGAEHIKDSEHGISLDEPHEAVLGDHACDKAKEEESNLSQKNGKDVSEKETESSHFVRKTDNVDGNEVGTLEKIAKSQENAESVKPNIKKKSKTKQSAVTKAPESDKDYGIETELVPARSKPMTIESTKVPSHAQEHISDGMPIEADNHMEVSSEGNKNFDKQLVPSQCKHEVVASGAVHAEEVTRTNSADNKPKAKKKQPKLDVHGSGPSFDLQSLLKSNENQGIGGKFEACKSSSIQLQGSLSKGDGVMSHPEKKVSKKVPKAGTKAPSSDTSGKMNSISEAAGKHSVAIVSGTNTRLGKKNEAFAVSNSNLENTKKVPKTGTKTPSSHTSGKMNSISEAAGKHSVAIVSGTNTREGKKNEAFDVSVSNLEKSNNKTNQNKMGNKSQSSVNRNHVASGKASGIDYGEVVNSTVKRKSSAAPRAIFKDDSSGSSEDEDKGDVSEASTQTPSDYSSSSAYSDGESNADMNSPRNGKSGGRSVLKSCSSGIKDLEWNELAKSSSTFKKAKLTASQSQLEDDDEFVPDSQPAS